MGRGMLNAATKAKFESMARRTAARRDEARGSVPKGEFAKRGAALRRGGGLSNFDELSSFRAVRRESRKIGARLNAERARKIKGRRASVKREVESPGISGPMRKYNAALRRNAIKRAQRIVDRFDAAHESAPDQDHGAYHRVYARLLRELRADIVCVLLCQPLPKVKTG